LKVVLECETYYSILYPQSPRLITTLGCPPQRDGTGFYGGLSMPIRREPMAWATDKLEAVFGDGIWTDHPGGHLQPIFRLRKEMRLWGHDACHHNIGQIRMAAKSLRTMSAEFDRALAHAEERNRNYQRPKNTGGKRKKPLQGGVSTSTG
jgi:hypothetical protein